MLRSTWSSLARCYYSKHLAATIYHTPPALSRPNNTPLLRYCTIPATKDIDTLISHRRLIVAHGYIDMYILILLSTKIPICPLNFSNHGSLITDLLIWTLPQSINARLYIPQNESKIAIKLYIALFICQYFYEKFICKFLSYVYW